MVALALAALWGAEPSWYFPVAAAAQSAAPPDAQRNARADYVGDDACRSCHADKVDSFHQTAHYLTSRPASGGSILGKFRPGTTL